MRHSEFNHDKAGVTHFLQIWIEPNVRGIAPGYEQKHFDAAAKRGRLRLVASPDGADGLGDDPSGRTHLRRFVRRCRARANCRSLPGARPIVHLVRGKLTANGTPLSAGDALKMTGISEVALDKGEDAEALLFDLP